MASKNQICFLKQILVWKKSSMHETSLPHPLFLKAIWFLTPISYRNGLLHLSFFSVRCLKCGNESGKAAVNDKINQRVMDFYPLPVCFKAFEILFQTSVTIFTDVFWKIHVYHSSFFITSKTLQPSSASFKNHHGSQKSTATKNAHAYNMIAKIIVPVTPKNERQFNLMRFMRYHRVNLSPKIKRLAICNITHTYTYRITVEKYKVYIHIFVTLSILPILPQRKIEHMKIDSTQKLFVPVLLLTLK